MTEVFHDEPIHQLNFHSSLMNPAKQELSVLYQKILIVIEGLGLFNSLRACRSYIAKGILVSSYNVYLYEYSHFSFVHFRPSALWS